MKMDNDQLALLAAAIAFSNRYPSTEELLARARALSKALYNNLKSPEKDASE